MPEPALRLVHHVELPAHAGNGAFDHAAVLAATGHVYVAHTANDAIDVFDRDRYLDSIPGLNGVAGVLACDDAGIVLASNRGENTLAIIDPNRPEVIKVAVGHRPNGIACDQRRGLALVANVGDPTLPRSHSVTLVDIQRPAVRATIEMPGRTRWAVFDPGTETFFANIAAPSLIVAIDARQPDRILRCIEVPAAGPHGLDLDIDSCRMFCACDEGLLVTFDTKSGKVLDRQRLAGGPDVIYFNALRRHLYVAIGDPGVIEVFDTATMNRIGQVDTEPGAHTLALDPSGTFLHAFLPITHRAAIFDTGAA